MTTSLQDLFKIKGSILVFVILLSSIYNTNAQNPDWQWGVRGGGAGSPYASQFDEKVTEIELDTSNNIYVGSNLFGASTNIEDVDVLWNGYLPDYSDVSIASFDSDGNFRWSKTIGSRYNDEVVNIETDAMGGVYLTGLVRPNTNSENYGTLDVHFDTDTIIPYSENDYEYKKTQFLIKYDYDGNFQWLRMPQAEDVNGNDESAGNLRSADLEVAPNGEIYWLVSARPGIFANGAFEVTEEGENLYIFHYDADGNFIEGFPLDFNFSRNQISRKWNKMVRDHKTGHFYFAGQFWFDDSSFSTEINGQPLNHSMYLLALDSQGNYLWDIQNTDTGPNGQYAVGKVTGLKLDDQGNIYLTGGAEEGDTFAGMEISGTTPFWSTILTVPFVMKLDSEGTMLWHSYANYVAQRKTSGGGISLNGNEVGIGCYYIDLDWGDYSFESDYNSGGDFMIARFNKEDGSIIEMREVFTVGSSQFNNITAMAADNRYNYYMGGALAYGLETENDILAYSMGGDTDFFVAKYGYDNSGCALPDADFTFEAADAGGVTFNFTGSAAYTEIEWGMGDGNTLWEDGSSVEYSYDEEGIYWVCATVYDSCGYDTFCQEVDTATLGVQNVKMDNLFASPNPAKQQVNISTSIPFEYNLFTLGGQKIKSGKLTAENREIDLSNFPSGIYMLQLIDGNQQQTIKIVKE